MKPKTWKPMVGGILLVIAGVIAVVEWALLTAVLAAFLSFIPGVSGIVFVCGAIGVIFGLIALLGGIMAIRRRMWGIAMVGSILGLFTIGFAVFFETSILSLIALILIAMSKKEF